MNLILTANSLGERIVISLAVLGLLVEMLSDNVQCSPQPEPMTIEACVDLCEPRPVKRVEGWACECAP